MYCSRRGLLRVALSLAGLAVASLHAGCASSSRELERRTCFNFDTVCVIGTDAGSKTLDEAVALCERYESLLSRTITTSDVSRINGAGGAPVEVDAITSDLIARALTYCEESGGLFDITIGAVSELWDFTNGIVPSDEAIEAALPHVGWEGVAVDGNKVTLRDPKARLDLGGIAKGYISDLLIDFLGNSGATSAFVNLGGNIKVLGPKEDGSPWVVGVRDPWDEGDQSVVARMSITEGSMVTSGLYERSFQKDGTRYWHILDPRTGWPVQTDIVSASINSYESIDGDGYTKPLFMLERHKALDFVQRHQGLQALLVDVEGNLWTTDDSDFEMANTGVTEG